MRYVFALEGFVNLGPKYSVDNSTKVPLLSCMFLLQEIIAVQSMMPQ